MTRHMFHMKRKRREMRSPALPKGIEAAEKAERERGGVGAAKADIAQSGVSARKATARALAREYCQGENKRRKAKGLNRLRQRKQQSNITISNSDMAT